MKGIIPELHDKTLKRVDNKWYASDGVLISHIPEEIVSDELYFEGATRSIKVNHYERSATARAKCIEHHGYLCSVCGFDFAMTYGGIGEKYIHVHHVVP